MSKLHNSLLVALLLCAVATGNTLAAPVKPVSPPDKSSRKPAQCNKKSEKRGNPLHFAGLLERLVWGEPLNRSLISEPPLPVRPHF